MKLRKTCASVPVCVVLAWLGLHSVATEMLWAVTLHTDDFQTDQAGWITGGSQLSRETSGGPAGSGDAFLRLEQGNHFAMHNSTAPWTGDLAATGGIQITADMMAAVGSAPLAMRVVLFGPGTSPQSSPRWTSTVATEVPADGVWRNYTFSLLEEDLTRVLGSNTYDALTGNLLQVMFRHDPGSPSSGGTAVAGNLGIDNITLDIVSPNGDFNGDGVVDGADFLEWQRGNSPTALSTSDLQDWQSHYGSEISQLFPVPEPLSGTLQAFCAVFCCGGRYARFRRNGRFSAKNIPTAAIAGVARDS